MIKAKAISDWITMWTTPIPKDSWEFDKYYHKFEESMIPISVTYHEESAQLSILSREGDRVVKYVYSSVPLSVGNVAMREFKRGNFGKMWHTVKNINSIKLERVIK